MIDLERWSYSPDIAAWLAGREPLDIWLQADYILAAPHRTLKEKMEGLKLLQAEMGEAPSPLLQGRLKDILRMGDLIEGLLLVDGRRHRWFFQTDFFFRGRKEELRRRQIFGNPKESVDVLVREIQEEAKLAGTDPAEYFGVVCVFHEESPRRWEHRWNVIVNGNGEALYCLPEGREDVTLGGVEDSVRLPYATGTVIELADNPFFPYMKGVLVNEREPWEEGFDREEQWLLYPEFLHSHREGIGMTVLDDYASIAFGADFLLPFRQFWRRREGGSAGEDQWLDELGALVKEDKECAMWILKGRGPKKSPAPYGRCRAQVRALSKKLGKKEDDRIHGSGGH